MEITKELKEKLLKADSAEDIKALLGNQVTEEEAAFIWQEITKRTESDGLKTLDDGDLKDVDGGMRIISEKNKDPNVHPILQLLKRLFGG